MRMKTKTQRTSHQCSSKLLIVMTNIRLTLSFQSIQALVKIYTKGNVLNKISDKTKTLYLFVRLD